MKEYKCSICSQDDIGSVNYYLVDNECYCLVCFKKRYDHKDETMGYKLISERIYKGNKSRLFSFEKSVNKDDEKVYTIKEFLELKLTLQEWCSIFQHDFGIKE